MGATMSASKATMFPWEDSLAPPGAVTRSEEKLCAESSLGWKPRALVSAGRLMPRSTIARSTPVPSMPCFWSVWTPSRSLTRLAVPIGATGSWQVAGVCVVVIGGLK